MTNTLQFHSWNKVEAGHYVYKTDDGYTATVRKDEYGPYMWDASATSPSGKVRDGGRWCYDNENMADARKEALRMIKDLVQQDETELVTRSLMRSSDYTTSEIRMNGGASPTSMRFTVKGDHYTYEVSVKKVWHDFLGVGPVDR